MRAMLLELLGQLDEQSQRIEKLNHMVEQFRRYIFGRRSEKVHPDQLTLAFVEAMKARAEAEPLATEEQESSPEDPNKPQRKKKGHGRKPLPEDLLPKERREYEVPESERQCKGCGDELARIGEDISKQLEYKPSSLFIIEHVRPKYACKRCQENVVTAPMPAQPINKGLPGPSLLAHLLVCKFCDHLPNYRQSVIFARSGVHLARSTLGDWVCWGAELLLPLYDAMKMDVLLSKIIHTDDTPVPVLDRSREQTRQARLWVYSGDKLHPNVVFDFTPNHTNAGPVAFLKGYHGRLQADAYPGYDVIYATGYVIEHGCMAHARRPFYEARLSDSGRAFAALGYIRRLYAIEREVKDLTADERKEMRLARAGPVLDEFRIWLESEKANVLPKSPIAGAINYALNHWFALARYLEDGDFSIDNNVSERELRRVAVGRKNWLFAGSDAGGRRAAIIYSIIATCKRHHIDPYRYLADVLLRLPSHPVNRSVELLPLNWKAEQERVADEASAARVAAA